MASFTVLAGGGTAVADIRTLDRTGLYDSLSYRSTHLGLDDLKRNLSNPLKNVAGNVLDDTIDNVVVLIHGWNAKFKTTPLKEGSFLNLTDNLDAALPASWTLVHYDWARDANTTGLEKVLRGIRGGATVQSDTYVPSRQPIVVYGNDDGAVQPEAVITLAVIAATVVIIDRSLLLGHR